MVVDSEQVWLYNKSFRMKQNTDEEEGVEAQTNYLDSNEQKRARRLRFQRCVQKAEQ
jgi:outer membrane lipoprotein-sorting protein